MWLAIKALSWKIKLSVFALIVAAILAMGAATYTIAYQKGLNLSKIEIANYEKEKAELQSRLDQAQGKIDVVSVIKYKDRIKTVDNIIYKNKDVIVEVLKPQFELSKGWVYAYNQSVLGTSLDAKKAADTEASKVTDVEALANTILPNIGICQANAEQLGSLQKWIRDTEASVEKINSGN
jgi:hypothetical protein